MLIIQFFRWTQTFLSQSEFYVFEMNRSALAGLMLHIVVSASSYSLGPCMGQLVYN